MPPKIKADEIVTEQHARQFIQFGGPRPDNPVQYAGKTGQYMVIEAVTLPDGNGKVEPIYVPDPRNAKRYRLVARKWTAPDLPKATLLMYERHGYIPRQLQKIGCPLTLYQVIGTCADLTDFIRGWTDYMMVYSQCEVDGDKNLGKRSDWISDNAIVDSIPLKMADIYPVGSLAFQLAPSAFTQQEVIDVVYGSYEGCGDCGYQDDGTQRIYAVLKSTGSTPGTAPQISYSTDGGSTWAQQAIDGIGGIEDPSVIDIAGSYLLVMTRTAGGSTTGGYYYAQINPNTGIPITPWTKVTQGFQSGAQPYDVYVAAPNEIYFCADAGTIYKATDITVGVVAVSQGAVTGGPLRRIHGQDNTIVAVGNSGVVAKSTNRGATWYTTITQPEVATLQAIWCIDDRTYWVGAADGTLWYTTNGGETWTQKLFSGSGAGQVRDIMFASLECGFFSHDTAAPVARVFATQNGGRDWSNVAPRVVGLPTYNRGNRFANPKNIDNPGIAVNNIALAGLAANGSSGVILTGIAGRV